MPNLWIRSHEQWNIFPLNGPRFALHDECGEKAVTLPSADGHVGSEFGGAILVQTATGPVMLLAAPDTDASVNGLPILGMRILAHRDEIRMGRQQMYFSTERLIRPEPFRGRDGICCARCSEPIAPLSLAVQCSCGLWFHQVHGREEHECWLYADRCCGCEAPTSIDADFAWRPQE